MEGIKKADELFDLQLSYEEDHIGGSAIDAYMACPWRIAPLKNAARRMPF